MLDIKVIIGIITVILGFVGYIPYIKDTIAGRTKPHIFTWFVWGSITMILFALQVSDNAGPGAWVTFVAASISLLIFVLGMRNGDKDITKFDVFFFILALTGLGLWLIAEQPIISTILLVSTGLLGFIPTVRKTLKSPKSETLKTYGINSFRHGLSFFALANYSVLTALFPLAWCIANGLFVVAILVKRKIG